MPTIVIDKHTHNNLRAYAKAHKLKMSDLATAAVKHYLTYLKQREWREGTWIEGSK